MTKELSVFIDESGDFGIYDSRSPYYIIGMVVHDQRDDISRDIQMLDSFLAETKHRHDFVHIGPLVRRETNYKYMTPEERAKILRRMLVFARKVPFCCKAFMVEKKHTEDDAEIIQKLARQLSDYMREHYVYFLSFDKIKIYYDNGQAGVMKIIMIAFTTLFGNVEFKKAEQKDYKLLQIADLVCTAKLLELKMKNKSLSKSERRVLGSDSDIMKNIIKPLKKKEFRE